MYIQQQYTLCIEELCWVSKTILIKLFLIKLYKSYNARFTKTIIFVQLLIIITLWQLWYMIISSFSSNLSSMWFGRPLLIGSSQSTSPMLTILWDSCILGVNHSKNQLEYEMLGEDSFENTYNWIQRRIHGCEIFIAFWMWWSFPCPS